MSNPRIAVRRLTLLLLLQACYTWRPVELAPTPGFESDRWMRVETKAPSTDSLVSGNHSTGKPHTRVIFHGASVVGDSLLPQNPSRHWWNGTWAVSYPLSPWEVQSVSTQPVATADVRRAEERRFSAWRTSVVGVGLAVILVVGYAAALAEAGAAY